MFLNDVNNKVFNCFTLFIANIIKCTTLTKIALLMRSFSLSIVCVFWQANLHVTVWRHLTACQFIQMFCRLYTDFFPFHLYSHVKNICMTTVNREIFTVCGLHMYSRCVDFAFCEVGNFFHNNRISKTQSFTYKHVQTICSEYIWRPQTVKISRFTVVMQMFFTCE
jgi:hypothetical protein